MIKWITAENAHVILLSFKKKIKKDIQSCFQLSHEKSQRKRGEALLRVQPCGRSWF